MSTTALTNDIVRVVLFVLAWVNSILVSTGHKTLPVIDESQIYWVITLVISIWAMVKDNPFKKRMNKPSEEPIPVVAKTEVVTPSINPAPVAPSAPVEAVAQPAEPRAPETAPTEEAPKTN